MAERAMSGRPVGILVPLFSIPSSDSWGIGEIGDLPKLGEWARAAGIRLIQLLPINEMADGQNSPYSALSAMAIDPIFISVRNIPGFLDAGDDMLSPADRRQLDLVRSAPAVDHRTVRELKTRVLRGLFDRFAAQRGVDGQAAALQRYIDAQHWWLDDYTLFRVEKSGVHGFIDKNSNTLETMREALMAIEAGHVYFSAAYLEAKDARRNDPRSFIKVLSEWERAILSLIGQGLTDDELGERLKISPRTVQTHRSHIMRKLDIKGTPKLIAFAIEHGFTQIPTKRGSIPPGLNGWCNAARTFITPSRGW